MDRAPTQLFQQPKRPQRRAEAALPSTKPFGAGATEGMSDAPGDENEPPKDSDAELEAAIAAIRGNKELPRPPYPTLPNMNAPAPMSAKIAAVQAYIEKLSYNFTGVNYFDVRKHRPMGRILETGRDVTRQALPIKCVEAVFVAAYLTQGLKDIDRVPFSFRSQIDGVTYKHIVLALKHNSKWGSVGLSRRRELYYKDLVYDSLAELFLEYKRSYERVFHTLRRVKVGLPLPHEVHAGEIICWSYVSVKCLDVASASQTLADHGRNCHRLSDQWRLECKKAKELGQKPPVPPQQQKRLEARKAKKEGQVLTGAGEIAKGATKGADGGGAVETDSSEDEREREAAAEAARDTATKAEDASEPPSEKDRNHSAEAAVAAIRAADAMPARPSFLAV